MQPTCDEKLYRELGRLFTLRQLPGSGGMRANRSIVDNPVWRISIAGCGAHQFLTRVVCYLRGGVAGIVVGFSNSVSKRWFALMSQTHR